ncbi:hypothetical protein [Polaribacter sp. HL-MS24]|uniref:hypothetical protein n=1 Tax=Polaribacter sp. HL-MS24 TaxID=3077735 RepID=UPI00293525A9|nr:hypothetical protein [Polaribacter sp. HL-MS24]WOC39349.1 hypothetical protein RRF69_06540 [Polaribacter sp. HL-MS24]
MRIKHQLLFFLVLMSAPYLYAQTPGLNYQALILNNTPIEIPGTDVKENQTPLGFEDVLFRFSITNNEIVEYMEEQSVTTDINGMVSLIVGEGTAIQSNFNEIVWNGELKYLNVEINILANNEGFTFLDSQKILYIPGPSKVAMVSTVGSITTSHQAGDLIWVANYGQSQNPALLIFNGTNWIPVSNDYDAKNELGLSVVANAAVRDVQFNPAIAGDQVWNQACSCIEVFDGTVWIATSTATLSAANGVQMINNQIRLGGDLDAPTEIHTSAINTLAIKNLQESTASSDEILTIDPETAIIQKRSLESLLQRQQVIFSAIDGQLRFATPSPILSTEKIDVYRNGARIGFVQIDATTIELEPEAICYTGDEIRIVQIPN